MESITSTSKYVYIINGLNNPIHKELIQNKIANLYFRDLKAMLE